MNARERPVIVLSTGRCGSTLVQKLLNTHEELAIWGEHEGLLNGLTGAWSAVMGSNWIESDIASGEWLRSQERPLNVDRWTAWDSSFSKSDFRTEIKKFIEGLFAARVPEFRRWGFKEIRYQQIEVMEFLLALYPGAQFILLLRNPVDACVSFVSAQLRDQEDTPDRRYIITSEIARNQISRTISFIRCASERFPESVTLMFYEHLVRSPSSTLEDVRKFLNLSVPFDDGVIAEMVGTDLMSQRSRNSVEQLEAMKMLALEFLAEDARWYVDVSR